MKKFIRLLKATGIVIIAVAAVVFVTTLMLNTTNVFMGFATLVLFAYAVFAVYDWLSQRDNDVMYY